MLSSALRPPQTSLLWLLDDNQHAIDDLGSPADARTEFERTLLPSASPARGVQARRDDPGHPASDPGLSRRHDLVASYLRRFSNGR